MQRRSFHLSESSRDSRASFYRAGEARLQDSRWIAGEGWAGTQAVVFEAREQEHIKSIDRGHQKVPAGIFQDGTWSQCQRSWQRRSWELQASGQCDGAVDGSRVTWPTSWERVASWGPDDEIIKMIQPANLLYRIRASGTHKPVFLWRQFLLWFVSSPPTIYRLNPHFRLNLNLDGRTRVQRNPQMLNKIM